MFDWTDEGLLKLHGDVETCGYEDVKVMWEILRRSEEDVIINKHQHHVQTRRKHKPFWKPFIWSNPTTPSPSTLKITTFPTFTHVS